MGETAQDRVEAFGKANAIFFWEPYPWQQRLLDTMHKFTTVANISSNKIGKTAAAVCILGSWALGYEPWNPVGQDHPMAVLGGETNGEKHFYHASSLGIKPPVNLIFTGEDWKTHIGQTVAPEMHFWWPTGWYKTKKNEQGVEYEWTWMNKSVVKIMVYNQKDDLFESFRIQGLIEDEPPPKSKHEAMSRGLMLDQGKTLMTMTPIKEAWVLDDVVLAGRRDIGLVLDLKITDNPDLYNSDITVLREMGLTEAQIDTYFDKLLYKNKLLGKYVEDKGRASEKYLEEVCTDQRVEWLVKLKILKFIKDIDPSDVPSRVFGQFKSLVGRVLKGFDEVVHVIEPFEVPANWPVVPMIDFHLSTPQAVSYWAVDPHDVHFCVAETWENLSADGIADDIIKKIRTKGWDIQDVYIDPLSKGDTQYMKNALGSNLRDTFSILYDRLDDVDIMLHVASKDKDSGIKNIEDRLVGPSGRPTVFIFEDCERHRYEAKRWVFDDNGKPDKKGSDHFMENWYRFTLTGTKFEDHVITPCRQEAQAAAGSWMGH